MESSPYTPMMPSSEGPNPYRPYYRPPSIGDPASDSAFRTNTSAPAPRAGTSFGSSARDILSDLDYRELLGDAAPTTAATARGLLDQAMWKYSSVFMAQPFEVAKTVLQVHCARTGARVELDSGTRRGVYEVQDDEEDDDEMSYFTSAAPRVESHRRRDTPSRTSSASSRTQAAAGAGARAMPAYKLELRRPDSLTEVLGQLWAREGAWGVWKGTNATFVYSLLLRTIETWTRGMLAALFNLPDPGMTLGGVGGLDIIDSPSPLLSLSVAVASAGLAGLLLSPLDIVRTRLMLTSSSDSPRSMLPSIRQLGSYMCPPSLFTPTLIHSTIPTLISTSTPLILRSTFSIDPIITPTSYSICTFLASTAELFVKLPFETVLRRGQIAFALAAPSKRTQLPHLRGRSPPAPEPMRTVVEVGPYAGVFGTMWRIAREEGVQQSNIQARGNRIERKGQGVQGLCRGWRVGWWGLVGVWSAAALGGASGRGGEF